MGLPMPSIGFSLYVVGALAAAMLLACKQTGPADVARQMARRTAELDRLSWQAGNPGLPPVRILIPVGGHDGDPPFGARRAFHAPGTAPERRREVAKGRPRHRLDAARPHAGDIPGNAGPGGTSEDNLGTFAPFWDGLGSFLGIPPSGLTSVRERSEDHPQGPAFAAGAASPFRHGPQPDD